MGPRNIEGHGKKSEILRDGNHTRIIFQLKTAMGNNREELKDAKVKNMELKSVPFTHSLNGKGVVAYF